jgi:nitrogenase molybdenum-iron protein beta chain
VSSNTNTPHAFIERPRFFCSFGGALSTLEALPDTIPVLHAASGCAGSVAWSQSAGGLQVGGYCGGLAVPSSNVGEREVIFGGAARLEEQLRRTLEIMDGTLFVAVTSCVTEMIGDDIAAVIAEIAGEAPAGKQVVFAKTGGFKGNSYDGYAIVLEALIQQFVQKPPGPASGGKASKSKKAAKTVNLLGIAPYMDAFWRGNIEGVRKLLEGLGVQVNSFFTVHDSLDTLRYSGGADLTLVVSDCYGIEAAKAYETRFAIPWIASPLPIGPTASAELLRSVAGALDLKVDVEAHIRKEQARFYRYLEPMTDAYYDFDLQRYAVIVADANYALGVSRFLYDDLGWLPAYVQFTELLSGKQQEELARKIPGNPLVVFDTNASSARERLLERYPPPKAGEYADTLAPAFVIGSSLERDLALKLGAPHLSLSFPVSNRAVLNRGYTGFSGGLTLAEDLISAIAAGR